MRLSDSPKNLLMDFKPQLCVCVFLLFLKCEHLVFRLKTIDVVIRNTKDAEDTLKSYETRLRDVSKVPGDEKEVEDQRSQLKVSRCFCIFQVCFCVRLLHFCGNFAVFCVQSMRAEAEANQVIFDRLQDELRRATAMNDKMTRIHSERDADLEHYRQLVGSLLERWQAVFAQMDLRQRELGLLGRNMNSYRESYEWLICWLEEAKQRQEKIQAVPIGDSKALREQLAQEKVL